MADSFDQQKLMELVVDKVLQKHGVFNKKLEIDEEEKAKIAEIVKNIKNEVESFLENSKVSKTENDFPSSPPVEMASDELVEDHSGDTSQQSMEKRKIFSSNNDTKSVKTFIKKRK